MWILVEGDGAVDDWHSLAVSESRVFAVATVRSFCGKKISVTQWSITQLLMINLILERVNSGYGPDQVGLSEPTYQLQD